MPIRASIIVPTRDRAEYLVVALASIMPQARDADAEVVVVDDGDQEAVREVAERFGARYLAHPSPRGLNAARNTGVEATDHELVVFVDDDVEVQAGWLSALLEAADRSPRHEVLGGPIHARLEGAHLPLCGREGPPITALDLGDRDREAEFVWGANFAVRRPALERIGPFDAALDLYGDEEDWQRRYKAGGGRVLYAAGAALDHRRSPQDARLAALAQAAYRRGRNSRRYDVRKGSPPALARELRTLAGCGWHTVRRRCANGILLGAHTAGRVVEALDPQPAGEPDFLSGQSGTVGGRRAALLGAADVAVDAGALLSGREARLARAARRWPPRRRVLALGVDRPGRDGLMAQAVAELRRSRHDVNVAIAPEPGGRGKFQNLNLLLEQHPARGNDWLVVMDDDVALPRDFLDQFLFLAERFGLRLAQPAHRRRSHAAWRVTRRRAVPVVRETSFVEIGPVTALHAETFETLLPFPDLRMGWGLDVHWAALARRHGWKLGVVDAVAVAHLSAPVAEGYPREEAVAEARAFLDGRPYVPREQAQRTLVSHPELVMRVAVVAEYYPRAADPVLGVWAHRQALAARAAGADVRVLVLHRPVPPLSSLRSRDRAAIAAPLRQPAAATLDGIPVRYVRYLSPPRPLGYGSWGAWAAPQLRLALRRLRRSFPFDLVHAHYAVPAGEAVRRSRPGAPMVVSVHGGDILSTVRRGGRARAAVERTLGAARVVLANSRDVARRCREHGAGDVRVVHLGTDLPAAPSDPGRVEPSTLVSVGHLVARKRHADVVRALWSLRDRHPALRYVVVGDGPERERLRELASRLGVGDRVELRGQLPPDQAAAEARRGSVFVLPSVDEAFGVAYIEAMAGGVPAVGCRGEPGPEDIAAAGGGMVLVAPRDVEALAEAVDALLRDPARARELGERGRQTVAHEFTWERCGRDTVAAYQAALR